MHPVCIKNNICAKRAHAFAMLKTDTRNLSFSGYNPGRIKPILRLIEAKQNSKNAMTFPSQNPTKINQEQAMDSLMNLIYDGLS